MSRDPVPPSLAGASPQLAGQRTSDLSQPEPAGVPPAVRAQLLATEHWSLLATRSTAQSEVLSRITTFLMLVSSSIVGLALIGQVTRFDGRFTAFALVLVGALVVIGTLAQMRVGNASIEDLAHVIGMNRLRAAYLELDSAIERYFVTSPHDDDKGVWQTYNHLVGQNQLPNVLASSGTFITVVTSGLAAAFAALVAAAFNAPGPIVGVVAAASGLSFLATALMLGMRRYKRIRGRSVLFPAPGAPASTP
jgi:Ca2+/Na+ antiporter